MEWNVGEGINQNVQYIYPWILVNWYACSIFTPDSETRCDNTSDDFWNKTQLLAKLSSSQEKLFWEGKWRHCYRTIKLLPNSKIREKMCSRNPPRWACSKYANKVQIEAYSGLEIESERYIVMMGQNSSQDRP